MKPNHFKTASGSVARACLKQLEAIGVVAKGPKGGRVITPQGSRGAWGGVAASSLFWADESADARTRVDLDRIAGRVATPAAAEEAAE